MYVTRYAINNWGNILSAENYPSVFGHVTGFRTPVFLS
jgi:hypothetical protein